MIDTSMMLALGLTIRLTKLVQGLVLYYFHGPKCHYFLIVSDHDDSDIPLYELHDIVDLFSTKFPDIGYTVTKDSEVIPADLLPKYVIKDGELKVVEGA